MSNKDIAAQLAQLRVEEGDRMEIFCENYKPFGGWDSDALKDAYLASLAGEEIAESAAPAAAASTDRKKPPAKKVADGDGLIPERYDESGLGDAFIEAHPELIWNSTRRTWMRYDSSRGVWDFFGSEAAEKMIDVFLKKVQQDGEEAFGKDDFAAGKRLGDQRTQEAVAKKIKTKRHIEQRHLDSDPYRRVFLNGVFDPRFPEKGMAPFDPELYATRCIALNYKPGATHPRVKDVLAPLPDDAHEWFQLMAGQSLLGFQPAAEFAIFLHGPTAGNGKSMEIDWLESTAGKYIEEDPDQSGYSARPDQATLLAGDNYDLVSFEGLSQAIIEELPDKHIHSSPFKRLIGTDSFKGRQIREKHRMIHNRATLWITCNIFPSIDSSDQGVIRRIKVIPFTKKFVDTPEELSKYPAGTAFLKDPSLKKMVKEDTALKEALLAFRMAGAIRWCAAPESKRAALEGAVPASVARATAAQLEREDTIQAWLDDCIIFDPREDENGETLAPAHYCLTMDLYRSYSAHLKASGHAYGVKLNTFQDRFELNLKVQASQLQKVRGRVSGLSHSRYETADGEFEKPGATPRHVKGIRFRTVLDDNEIKPGLTAEEIKRLKLIDLVNQMTLAGIAVEDLAEAMENDPRILVPADASIDDLEDLDD